MKSYRRSLRAAAALALALAMTATGCSFGRKAGVSVPAGKAPQVDTAGSGPHNAASVMARKDTVAVSGWLELFLDDASKTVSIRSHSETEWSTLPRTAATPQANQSACAVEADIYAGGQKITLNSQDHAVAYGNVTTEPIKEKSVEGVAITYTLTPNRETAEKAANDTLTENDVAFDIQVRYTLSEGNFRVQADWENRSGNPDAFIAELGLMERFGALRSPGPNDFFLLPDGVGALLYPAKEAESAAEDLVFSVYGEDPSAPSAGEEETLHANVAAFGVHGQDAGFVAVAEQGAALADIAVRQSIPGEIAQSAVGFRFRVTPVALNEDGAAAQRAAQSYGENDDESLSVVYRFFFGANANFNTMAIACREQLISIGILSSTKTVRDVDVEQLPLNLTLLGTGRKGRTGTSTLTTFEQAQDILMRMKNNGINSINVRYQGIFRGGWQPKAPENIKLLSRLGGSKQLESLQKYSKSKGLSLYLDVQLYPSGGGTAKTLTGKTLRVPLQDAPWDTAGKTVALRKTDTLINASRSLLSRLGGYETAGLSLGDAGRILYADYSGEGHTRLQAEQQLDQVLPALTAHWRVMLDTGNFYAARYADVIMNLPMTTQVQMSGDRYVTVPLLPMLLHSNLDYSGTPLNLADNPKNALLRSIAFGACPSYVWQASDADTQLHFESHMDNALSAYNRSNTALADLRAARIVGYSVDAKTGISTTQYSNDAVIYVNYSETEQTLGDITIPPMDFVRIG